MTKTDDIDEIIKQRPIQLLMDVLWDDPIIIQRIQEKLDNVSTKNIKHYHKHFMGDNK